MFVILSFLSICSSIKWIKYMIFIKQTKDSVLLLFCVLDEFVWMIVAILEFILFSFVLFTFKSLELSFDGFVFNIFNIILVPQVFICELVENPYLILILAPLFFRFIWKLMLIFKSEMKLNSSISSFVWSLLFIYSPLSLASCFIWQ